MHMELQGTRIEKNKPEKEHSLTSDLLQSNSNKVQYWYNNRSVNQN
jgi:hypothetical protein